MPPNKKTKLDTDWSWAGIEAETPLEITHEHRRRAAGLYGLKPCRFTPYPPSAGESSTSARSTGGPGCSSKLCKKNPRCYNHLGVEKVTGTKAKEEFVENAAGSSPELRDGREPIGLRNMGATCYLWYHNLDFRNGLYSCVTSENFKLYHLVKVFAYLEHSKRKVVDPSGLVKALNLNAGTQQDAGEFSKLFMDVINRELQRQTDPQLQSLYKRLFQGRLAYVTQCHGCGAKSSREESFLELELSLKNNDTLSDRLSAFCHPEVLDGDNKYRCGTCTNLCAATRQVEIRALPQYIHFSLLRFTYDIKAGERKKSKAVIRYSKTAQFAGFQYELSAIVVHLGSSPFHGHFVCELYDEGTKEWYTFSDEQVTKRVPNALKKLGQPDDGLESSKDAYMLVYRKKESSTTTVSPQSPSEAMMKEIRADNDKLELEVIGWQDRREGAGMAFDELMNIKMPVISALSGNECIIPRDELSRWLEGDKDALLKPIDYTSLTCEHSTTDQPRLDPSKMGDARLISQMAFDILQRTTPCASADICSTCISDTFKHKVSASDREDQVRQFDELNNSQSVDIDGPRYLISKVWLDKWKKHKLDTGSLPTDNGYSLYCFHDAPYPGDRPKEGISAGALVLLQSVVGDFDAFHDQAAECNVCAKSGKVDEQDKAIWISELKKDKAYRKEMNPRPVIYDTDYYLISVDWNTDWQNWKIGRPIGPRPAYDAGLCPHSGYPLDPANDLHQFITKKGWEAMQEIYGPQTAVKMQFRSNVIPGKKQDIELVSHKVCEACRRLRRLQWEETNISILPPEEGSGADDDITVLSDDKDKDKDKVGEDTRSRSMSTYTSRTRPRRCAAKRNAKPLVLEITQSTTVRDLKVEIYNTFKISPISQQLWYEGKELDDGSKTMGEVEMVKDGEIRLVELQEEDEDGMMMDGTGKRGEGGGGGNEGFGGTALVGVKKCPDCTFDNECGAEMCMMCMRPFMV